MSVIVTGGGSGIGAGTARYLAARGARVTICGRRQQPLDEVVADIGDSCQAVRCDVTSDADRARLVDAALEHGGGVDVLVNAAANMYRGELDELRENEVVGLYHTNVVAPMMLSRQCLPHLRERQGAIILFGSVHTVRAFPGASPYAGTKGALEALTGVLAAELGPQGVRVSCVRPGAVLTELNQRAGLGDATSARERLQGLASAHALGRIGEVEEIAEAVAHLACAEWTTGAVMTVDGGLSLGVTNA